ncbi:hypothetical protein [Streptosporangium roseum]|uniref:hypothetical protein n=1 Tax=Streptosporangium roseum TaxID=2001 RepID=UPI0001A3D565|nr:hypothetical protein [Streptosporangium roseum]
MTPAHTAAFDEALSRPMPARWLPETSEIRTQSHEIHGHHVVVIHIAPNPTGCAFFRADGQEEETHKSRFFGLCPYLGIWFRPQVSAPDLGLAVRPAPIAVALRRIKGDPVRQFSGVGVGMLNGLRRAHGVDRSLKLDLPWPVPGRVA